MSKCGSSKTFIYRQIYQNTMKIMMVEGRYNGEIDLSNLDASALPERIGLATTVQFLD